jgi:hypothetical protein
MALNFYTLTIPAGDSVSNAVNINSEYLMRIVMPDNWTPGANLTVEVSPDNIAPYRPLYTIFGRVQIPVVPGAAMLVGVDWSSLEWVRLRSGTPDAPHIQQAARTLIFGTDTKATAVQA